MAEGPKIEALLGGYGVITRRELLRVLSLASGSFAVPVDWQRLDSIKKHAT